MNEARIAHLESRLERRSNPQTIRSFLLFCHQIQAADNEYLADLYRPSIAESKGHAEYMFHQLTQPPLLSLSDWASIFKTPLVLPKGSQSKRKVLSPVNDMSPH